MMLSIFPVLVGHLYILFGERTIQIFHPFKNCVVFLLVSCKSSLHTLVISLLQDI